MNFTWDKLELPGGQLLVRDEVYGYLKVMPRPSDEEIAAYYRNAYSNPCIPHDPDGRADIVCEIAESPGRILDIGCGAGEFLCSFTKRGWQTVGVEPGKEYAEKARSRGIEVIEESLTDDLVKRLGTFDAVLLIHVLEHVPYPEHMLRLVRDLLGPGGLFLCEVPNDFNPLQEVAISVQGLRPWWIALPDHLNYFSISTLASCIAGHGFEILVQTTDFPVEMFLLWGDIYVDNPEAGSSMHGKRCRFERAMRQCGKGKLLRELYDAIAKLEIGREAIVCAKKSS